MSDYLQSAELTHAHYQTEAISPLVLWQIEIDIQQLAREIAEYPLHMDESVCETLAVLYRLRRNLQLVLESDRQRENRIERAIYSRFIPN